MANGNKRVVGRRVLAEAFATGDPVHCEYCNDRVSWADHKHLNGRLAVADHRIPLSRGGADSEDNIAIACKRCDHEKGPLTGDEYVRLRLNCPERKRLIAFVLLSISNRDLREAHVRQSRGAPQSKYGRRPNGQVPGGRSVDRELRRQEREQRRAS